jgi:hypothetical protein
MFSLIKTLLGQFANHIAAIGAAAAAAALLAYFRSEASAAIQWVFDPITRCLPWNVALPNSNERAVANLSSELTLVDVFLMTRDGATATYKKTGEYLVDAGPLSSYYEGVTASGTVSAFSSELGAVIETETEHGFFVSRIDLGAVFDVGTHFRNVYQVQLDGCFIADEEHWTQEIAVPTNHLTLRIHFHLSGAAGCGRRLSTAGRL